MTADLTTRLERCYTGVLNDVMRNMGLRNFVLPPEIRPLFPDRPLAGPVFTVSGHADEAADAHTTLLEWTGLLSKASPGRCGNAMTTARKTSIAAPSLPSRHTRSARFWDGAGHARSSARRRPARSP